jgi:hypothetical protein
MPKFVKEFECAITGHDWKCRGSTLSVPFSLSFHECDNCKQVRVQQYNRNVLVYEVIGDVMRNSDIIIIKNGNIEDWFYVYSSERIRMHD